MPELSLWHFDPTLIDVVLIIYHFTQQLHKFQKITFIWLLANLNHDARRPLQFLCPSVTRNWANWATRLQTSRSPTGCENSSCACHHSICFLNTHLFDIVLIWCGILIMGFGKVGDIATVKLANKIYKYIIESSRTRC